MRGPWLHPRWKSLRRLGAAPFGIALQRLDRACFVEVEKGVELQRQLRMEVAALALGVRAVDHADRALEPRLEQRLRVPPGIAQGQHEAPELCRMHDRLIA